MDTVNRSTTAAPWGLVTSAAARAKLRERATERKAEDATAAELLPARPGLLRWTGRQSR